MKIVRVLLEDGTLYLYEFNENPSESNLNAAMDGIGGRPPDRKPPQ